MFLVTTALPRKCSLLTLLVFTNICSAEFLTVEEKAELKRQLATDAGTDVLYSLEWKHVIQAFYDFKIYANMLQSIGVYTSLYSISLFLPTICNELEKSTNMSQLLAVPVYLCAATLTIAASFLADKFKQRGFFVLGFELFTLVGLLILLLSRNHIVQYAATFVVAGGKFLQALFSS